jgi:hypothetical protein
LKNEIRRGLGAKHKLDVYKKKKQGAELKIGEGDEMINTRLEFTQNLHSKIFTAMINTQDFAGVSK